MNLDEKVASENSFDSVSGDAINNESNEMVNQNTNGELNTSEESNSNDEEENLIPDTVWDINTFSNNEAIKLEDGTTISFKELKEILSAKEPKSTNNVTQKQTTNTQMSTNLTSSSPDNEKLLVQIAGIILENIYEKNASKYPLVELDDLKAEIVKIPNPDFSIIEPLMKKINEREMKRIERKSKIYENIKTNTTTTFKGEMEKPLPPKNTTTQTKVKINDIENLTQLANEYLKKLQTNI